MAASAGQTQAADDAFLTKYDGAGNLLWSRQIGTTDYDDYSRGVAVDAAGNAYISGYTDGSLGGPNAGGVSTPSSPSTTARAISSGRARSARQTTTISHGVAVDAAGNAYISGYTSGSLGGPNAGGWDAFLTKYDGAGNLLWSRQIGTTDDDYDGVGVAVDAAGNAYISGPPWQPRRAKRRRLDAFLTKYDGAGNLLWSRQIGTTALDISRGVAVDAAGNAYISGFTYGSLGGPNAGENDAFLTKYDGAGNLLWSRQIGTTVPRSSAEDVAVDAAGNAYIGGSTYSGFGNGGPRYAFLVKFSVPEPSSLLLLAAFVVAGLLNSRRSLR